MKTLHTPESAAKVVRIMFAGKIATTWPEYFQNQVELNRLRPSDRALGGTWLNLFKAHILVREQCNGIKQAGARVRKVQYNDKQIQDGIAAAIPELFAEYWEAINAKEFASA